MPNLRCTLVSRLPTWIGTVATALALVAALPVSVSAQSLAAVARPPVPGQAVSPESFAREYVAAVRKGDWAALGRYFHPDALAEFRKATKVLMESTDPRAREARVVLSGSESGAALRDMSDEVFFATFASQVLSQLPKDARDLLFKPMGEVLGAVPDGAEVVHVVYRTRVPVLGTFVDTTDVMTTKRTATGWGVLLNREFAMFLLSIGELK